MSSAVPNIAATSLAEAMEHAASTGRAHAERVVTNGALVGS
jgi:hypothetical protein